MSDETMKIFREFEESLCSPEEDLEVIRWFLKLGEYEKGGELLAVFEKQYEHVLKTAGMNENQYQFWILKLEMLTQGFTKMKLGYEEEQAITRLYSVLVRMNRLPVRGMRYLFSREDFLRIQKKLDYLDAYKIMKRTVCTVICLMLMLTLVLYQLYVGFGLISKYTITVILLTYSTISAGIVVFAMTVCKQSYRRWQDFLMHPVPFEHSDLF